MFLLEPRGQHSLHPVLCRNVWLLTFNQGFEVDMFSNRHMPDSSTWKLQSEHMGVVVHLSLRNQHTVPIEESCKGQSIDVDSFNFLGLVPNKQANTECYVV